MLRRSRMHDKRSRIDGVGCCRAVRKRGTKTAIEVEKEPRIESSRLEGGKVARKTEGQGVQAYTGT